MTFDDLNLNKGLRQALADLEYTTPTPIQVESFPLIMSGRDMVGIAQTGTGKTFAYLLPLLRNLTFSKEPMTRILVIVPTRELVIQVVGEVEKLLKYSSFTVGGAYGGTNIKTQKKLLHEGVDVLVATPGRLLDLLYARSLRAKDIRKLVIDEVDEMLNLGFRVQLMNILDLLPERRQNLLFSATMTDEVAALIDTHFDAPATIQITPRGTPVDLIQQQAYLVPNFYSKINLLRRLLQHDASMDRVLIFIGSKKLADMLYEQLLPDFESQLGIIHSNKSQNFRINAIRTFEAGEVKYLIATDLIARGMDIHGVSHVINMDIPEVPENYIHRIGRTGRADQEGIAISLIAEYEQDYQEGVEALMKRSIEMLPLPEGLELSTEVIPFEVPRKGGDKNYLAPAKPKNTGGAYHEKKLKNTKVNLAHEKRLAWKREKARKRSQRKPKKN